jgi:hypothetical protein
MPHTITAVSLGNAGKTASPMQIPRSSGYVQNEPVRRSISWLRNASSS